MAELYISRLSNEDIVRIDARDGRKLLSRVEVSLENFAAALMGVGAVEALFTTERDAPGYRAPRR